MGLYCQGGMVEEAVLSGWNGERGCTVMVEWWKRLFSSLFGKEHQQQQQKKKN